MSDARNERSDEGAGRVVRLVPANTALPANLDPYGTFVGYGAGDAPSNLGIDFLEYWRTIYKRRWLILSILSAFVALGLVRTLMQTPLYMSTVRLQIDYQTAKVVEGGNVTADQNSYDYDFLKTQYELIQSRAMAERVASALKLGRDTDFFKPRGASLLGLFSGLGGSASGSAAGNEGPGNTPSTEPSNGPSDADAAGIVVGNMQVRPVPGSRLVDVSYSDTNPGRAQRIANAYADAFIASNLDKRFEANAYAKTFLEDQIKQLKLRLEESEKGLLDFAQKEQIVEVNEKSSIAENNLAAANAALGNLASERIKNEQLWKQVASADAINLPQLLTNSVIDGLRGKRNVLVTEYQEKLETFKPSYPAMVQIDNKIKEIDRQLANEVKTIKASYKAAYESALSQETELEARIKTLRADVIDLQKRSIQYNILKREVDTNRGLYNGLLQRFKEVDIAGGVGANNIFIVDRGQLPGGPYAPSLSRSLLLSLMLGLGAGLGAAFFIEHLDDTVHSPEEIEKISGLASLGVIPKATAGGSPEEALFDPRSAVSEAYRSLCTALQFSTDQGLPKTLLVTSASPGEGKSITSLAIARHFATMGMKVLVVDADLRNPSLHKKLGLDNSIGLSNYLTGGCTPPEAFQASPIANLAFMASGPLPPNAADLLGSARLHSLLSIGLEVFDLIVVDGPPVMGLADAMLLSNATSATVFVIAAGQARTGLVRGALRRLQIGRAPIIGTILTKYNAKAAGYGYGHSYGEYAYTYGGQLPASDKKNANPQLSNSRAGA